jgi:hypothetical protein
MGDTKWRTKKLRKNVDINRLNINVNGIPTSGFVGSDDLFNNVAARVGVPLPKEYIDFIRESDGGHPEVGSFFPQGEGTEGSFSIDWFYTFSNPNVENINTALDGWGKVLGKMILPIARDGGGNQFCLNLIDAVLSVWLYLHDEKGKPVKLADSFEEFISVLTINPDFI